MQIQAPNHFQCPNDLVDHWLPLLKEGELRLLLIIIRKTFGWHKKRDRISISQLEKLSGMHRKSVCRSLISLISKGVILKEIQGVLGSEEVFYSLIVIEDTNVLKTCDQCPKDTPPSVLKTPTKETTTKERTTTSKEETMPASPLADSSSLSPSAKDELLSSLNLNDATRKRALKYSIEDIERAIKCLEAAGAVDSPSGFFMKALKEGWTPFTKNSVKKPNDIMKEIENIIKNAPKLKPESEIKIFEENIKFSWSENGKICYNYATTNEDGIRMIKQFIEMRKL